MSSTVVAIHQPENALALTPDQAWWTEKQVAILNTLGVRNASDADLAVFMHVCQRTGLDPFARQIYMIERDGKQTIQTGIDGYRLVARRAADQARHTLSIGEAFWCADDGLWRDIWLSDSAPAAAKVTVVRDGGDFPGKAIYREYVQTKRGGEITTMWRNRPAGQLAKCAEALALRKAFPQDLSGVYVDAELQNDDRHYAATVEPASGSERVKAALDKMPMSETFPGTEPDEPEPKDIADAPELIRPQQMKLMQAEFKAAGIKTQAERHQFAETVIEHPVNDSNELTVAEASAVIDALKGLAQVGPPDDAWATGSVPVGEPS